MRIALSAQSWKDDTSLLPLPWREVDKEGKGLGYESWSGSRKNLRVGVMRDDGVVRPVQCIQRALSKVVGDLRKGGVEVVEVKPRDFAEGWELIVSPVPAGWIELMSCRLNCTILTERRSYAIVSVMSHYFPSRNGSSPRPHPPHSLQRNSAMCVSLFLCISSTIPADPQLISRRDTLRQEWLTYFRSLKVDVLLLPAGPAPAQVHGTTKYWSYTSMFNLLDWPGAVFPTGLVVDSSVDQDPADSVPKNEDERHLFETCKSITLATGGARG
jgi:Asp-tRNA(Asn)/Glu-tRNA(Gln) amidotransferase A subunit family amidase